MYCDGPSYWYEINFTSFGYIYAQHLSSELCHSMVEANTEYRSKLFTFFQDWGEIGTNFLKTMKGTVQAKSWGWRSPQ